MSKDLLGATYYPSCVVNLKIRFDDAYTNIPSTAEARTVDGTAANTPTAGADSLGNLAIMSGTKDGNSHLVGRIPKTCSVEIPAYRQAGKFRMTFDYRDLPIDPRLIRSVGVEIYMDTVSADTFAQAVPQVNPAAGRGATPSRLSMLKATPENMVLQGIVDSWSVSHTNKGSEATIEGRDLVGMMLNTPITAEAIGQLTLGQPIDAVIRQLLYTMQGWASGLQVQASPAAEWDGGAVPIIGKAITEQVATPRARKGAGEGKAVRLSVGADPDKLNFWDVVTRWCYYVGAVPSITLQPDGSASAQPGAVPAPYKVTLLIRPANTVYDQLRGRDKSENDNTPFKDNRWRSDDAGNSFAIRRMMFGRNVEQLNFERKYSGRNNPKLIRVVSYDTSSDTKGEGRLLQADYPTEWAEAALAQNEQDVATRRAEVDARRAAASAETDRRRAAAGRQPLSRDPKRAARSREAPSGEIAAQDMLRISIPGIKSQSQLQNLAKQIYEELNRGEMGGSCHTKSLASFGAGNEDPDLVRIRPGDGIQLQVDARDLQARAPNVSPLNAMHQKSDVQLIDEIAARLGDRLLATMIVQSLRDSNQKLANIYRVSNVKFDWNITSGIAVAFDFHNYVEPRNNVSDTPMPAGAGDLPGLAVPPVA